MASSLNNPHPGNAARTSGAILGILVFLVGIALLGYVFMTARDLFDAPPPALPPATAPTPAPAGAASAATPAAQSAALVLGQSLTQFAQRLLVLLVMCVAGSVISSKGIELFFKALAAASPPPPGGQPGGGSTSAASASPAAS